MSPHDGHAGNRAWVGGSGVGGNYKPRGEGGKGKHESPIRHALIGEDVEQLVHHHLCFLWSIGWEILCSFVKVQSPRARRQPPDRFR